MTQQKQILEGKEKMDVHGISKASRPNTYWWTRTANYSDDTDRLKKQGLDKRIKGPDFIFPAHITKRMFVVR